MYRTARRSRSGSRSSASRPRRHPGHSRPRTSLVAGSRSVALSRTRPFGVRTSLLLHTEQTSVGATWRAARTSARQARRYFRAQPLQVLRHVVLPGRR